MDWPIRFHVGVWPCLFIILGFLAMFPTARSEDRAHVRSTLTVLAGTPLSPARRMMDFTKPTAWTNATVFYRFADNFLDGNQKRMVLSVMDILRNKTCIQFTSRNNEHNYTVFSMGPGCASMVGMAGSKQTVFLTDECFTQSRISRQIIHLLGFHSELNRPDRDQYIEINWQNIRPGVIRSFVRYPPTAYLATHVPFDFASVSHLDGLKFALDPTVWTVRAKSDHTLKLGSDRGFSELDINKINELYCSFGNHS